MNLRKMMTNAEPLDWIALGIAKALLMPIVVYAYVDSTSRLAKVRKDTLEAWDLRNARSKRNMDMYKKYYLLALEEAKK
ncbi:MAG: hypothetical protein ACK4NQ_11000 [Fimbriimonadaceae bacterium]